MFETEALRFTDRAEAGRSLARRLAALHLPRPVIYALPRGGVPVAAEIAAALAAPLDLILVRKIGAPFQPELALGAVAEGEAPEAVLNPDIIAVTGADEAFIAAAQAREMAEIERRRQLYLAGRPRPDPQGCSAVVVDDGLATGATARAALHALRRRDPAQIILAVPVASPDTLAALRAEADTVVCLREASLFHGVGGFYEDFHQLADEEVIRTLDAAAKRLTREGGGAPPG
ncbi:phosphoribosyltransferase family protein [Roseomonas sp. E05]|uniref:phosphoribosyltransferase n=1 Tax=Roseomonas sp. E05 TaxID=3046310 RepID=UPI0024BAAC81|nr:phosphoribosyltransferase family protein [Roseomonas sp. E05]MDJ0389514.1 phosphoribosyltransferase family protein [Roseomonas sp. E05]